MHAHHLHYQVVSEVKMLLFLVWTIVYQCILIIEKNILVLREGATDGIDDTVVTAGAK